MTSLKLSGLIPESSRIKLIRHDPWLLRGRIGETGTRWGWFVALSGKSALSRGSLSQYWIFRFANKHIDLKKSQ